MAAIAPITIADGASTPVDHTFNPIKTNPPVYHENGDPAVPLIGEPSIEASIKWGSGDGAVNRARVQLRIPVLETQSGSSAGGYEPAPKQAYFLTADLSVLLPSRCTLAQRKDLRIMMANLLGDGQIEALIDKLEAPY